LNKIGRLLHNLLYEIGHRLSCLTNNSYDPLPCLHAAVLTLQHTGSPQRDDYDSPTMNPHYDNRSPSPGRPLQGYQLDDAPYRPQGPPLQMPMASSDRLAVQPTVCNIGIDWLGQGTDIESSTRSKTYIPRTATTNPTICNTARKQRQGMLVRTTLYRRKSITAPTTISHTRRIHRKITH
jgi:hypothetical protein